MKTETSRPASLIVPAVIALAAGVAALAFGGLDFTRNAEQFTRSYLPAYVFWLGLPLGALGLRFLHGLTGGRWGQALRRILEAATKTIPLMALGALPLLPGLRHLYPWLDPHEVEHHPLLQAKAFYLNEPGFLARAAFYAVLWTLLVIVLQILTRKDDGVEGSSSHRRLQGFCGAGLILYVLSVSFAVVDWVMSLEPEWFSTIYGVHFVIGQGISILAFSVLALAFLSSRGLIRLVTADHYHDLGGLLFAFVMLWAYMSLSQFLIIWSANLPEEIPWYLARSKGGWETFAILLIGSHFVLPFFLLLQRAIKRKAAYLSAVALFIFVIHYADLLWYIIPAFHPGKLTLHIDDFVFWIGLGGVWIGLFLLLFDRRPLAEPAATGRGH